MDQCIAPNEVSSCVLRHKAQLVEHSADNGEAEGSNPSMPIKQVEWNKVIAFGAGSGGSIPSPLI